MKGYGAEITIVCPFPSADFLQEVGRDGLAIDDGDHPRRNHPPRQGFFTAGK